MNWKYVLRKSIGWILIAIPTAIFIATLPRIALFMLYILIIAGIIALGMFLISDN